MESLDRRFEYVLSDTHYLLGIVTRRWQADSVFETKEHGIQIQKETICPGREPATRVSSKRLYETVRDVTTLAGEH